MSMNERILAVLEKLENVPGKQEKFWNVSVETGKFLNILTSSSHAKTVLEIGTSNGYSGIWFAEALSHTDGKLYTVESHKERFGLASQHFKEAGVDGSVEQIFGHAPEVFATSKFKDRGLMFDIIFLDATKMEYASYFDAVLPLLKINGLLLADNMLSHEQTLESFLNMVKQKRELRSVVLPLGSGLMVATKTA